MVNLFKKAFDRVLYKITIFRRNLYRKKRSKLIKDKDISIISLDCMGGVISHDLCLKFNSPTVNLYFTNQDFIKFVNNLFEYLEQDFVEVFEDGVDFPIGQLIYNEQPIKVYFMHYKSFLEATTKWKERAQRIIRDKIFIIHHIWDVTAEDIERFDALPFKNKLLVTNENPTNSKNVCVVDLYKNKDFYGKLLNFTGKYSVKRYLEVIDYITFLNNGLKNNH